MNTVFAGGSSRWPQGMVVTIENHSSALEELLWIRGAYALRPAGDVPPALVHPPAREGRPDDAHAWEHAWPELWHEALLHASTGIAQEDIDELARTEDASPGGLAALRALHGPSWRDRFGDAALKRGYREWSERRCS